MGDMMQPADPAALLAYHRAQAKVALADALRSLQFIARADTCPARRQGALDVIRDLTRVQRTAQLNIGGNYD